MKFLKDICQQAALVKEFPGEFLPLEAGELMSHDVILSDECLEKIGAACAAAVSEIPNIKHPLLCAGSAIDFTIDMSDSSLQKIKNALKEEVVKMPLPGYHGVPAKFDPASITPGMALAALAKAGIGVTDIHIAQDTAHGQFVKTHLSLTIETSPQDQKAVAALASLTTWASSHGKHW